MNFTIKMSPYLQRAVNRMEVPKCEGCDCRLPPCEYAIAAHEITKQNERESNPPR